MQHIVIKAVFFIPEIDAVATPVVHCVGNVNKVFEELAGNVRVGTVFLR
jgi:hypothetical protein